MADNQVLHAVISAVDDATKTIRSIKEQLAEIDAQAGRTGDGIKRLGETRSHFENLGSSVKTLTGHFGALQGGIGSVYRRITNLIPAMAGLGAVGSLAGLFGLVGKVAETGAEFDATAKKIGLTMKQLGEFNTLAKVTHVPVESMQKALMKLQVGMADAAHGKNKAVAAIFHKMHFSLTGAHGGVRDLTEALPALADAFQHTSNAAVRTDQVRQLFGKSGNDLLPMLLQGSAGMRDILKSMQGLGYGFTKDDTENLKAYTINMLMLKSAVNGVTNAVGAALAPVLVPVLATFRDWIKANRDWIATGIKQAVVELANNLQRVNWVALGDGLLVVLRGLRWIVDELGGFARVVEVIVGLRILEFLVNMGKNFAFVAGAATKAAAAIRGASSASAGAAAGQAAGAGASAAAGQAAGAGTGAAEGAAAGAGGGLFARWAASALRIAGPIGAFLYMMRPSTTNQGEEESLAANGGGGGANAATLSRLLYQNRNMPQVRLYPDVVPDLPRIAFPSSEMPAAPARQFSNARVPVDVTVSFSNMPPGTQVTAKSSVADRVNINLGYAFDGMAGAR